MVYLSLSNDIGQVTADLSKGTLTDPKMTECLEYVAQLMEEGLLPEALVSYKSADADRIFMSGQAAVMYGGPNKVYWDEPAIADKLDILPPPMGLSAIYLSIVFKNTGQNFRDYLISRKIERAKAMLVRTDARVYEIAEAVGYSDIKYFSRNFKRLVGMTPQEYRQHMMP